MSFEFYIYYSLLSQLINKFMHIVVNLSVSKIWTKFINKNLWNSLKVANFFTISIRYQFLTDDWEGPMQKKTCPDFFLFKMEVENRSSSFKKVISSIVGVMVSKCVMISRDEIAHRMARQILRSREKKERKKDDNSMRWKRASRCLDSLPPLFKLPDHTIQFSAFRNADYLSSLISWLCLYELVIFSFLHELHTSVRSVNYDQTSENILISLLLHEYFPDHLQQIRSHCEDITTFVPNCNRCKTEREGRVRH